MMDWPAAYVGIPYKLRGRSRGGLDCWGLVRLVMLEQKGIELPLYDTVNSTMAEAVSSAVNAERGCGDWVQVSSDNRREFDFIVMRTAIREFGRMVSADMHIGMTAPQGMILHVQEGDSAVMQPFKALKNRIAGIYRHKELA